MGATLDDIYKQSKFVGKKVVQCVESRKVKILTSILYHVQTNVKWDGLRNTKTVKPINLHNYLYSLNHVIDIWTYQRNWNLKET